MSAYQSVLDKIQRLSVERHELYLLAAKQELSPAKHRRLTEITDDLGTLWLKRKTMRAAHLDQLEVLIQSSWIREPGSG